MEIVALIFSVFGFIAFCRMEKLVRELKQKDILKKDYKED